ncbi:MAG: GNAT family N-acetyltransferase [Bacillales bacterium]|nr:GNAT family N-acetyltransferase [Bacillales bacterium]
MPLHTNHQEWIEYLYETKEYFLVYFRQLQLYPQLYGFGPWLIIEKNSKTIIGDTGFKGYPNQSTLDIGYNIIPNHQNFGYATESVNALSAWAFQTGLVHRITAACYDWNFASISVLQKCQYQITEKKNHIIYWQLSYVPMPNHRTQI